MQEYGYFQKALADFTYEAASGGAIRHLTDLGYTIKQIAGLLDFPTSYERVQKGVWERLLETEVILTTEPGSSAILEENCGQKAGNPWKENKLQNWREPTKKAKYVREYDQYGKASFRRVEEVQETEIVICWKEYSWTSHRQGVDELFALLQEKRQKNSENKSYMSCDFGWLSRKEPEKFQAIMEVLQERQREYISGLPWEMCRIYHRLDARMMEILLRLCEAGMYQGECFFMDTKDRIVIREI